jgi:putative DNA methylase
MAGYRKKLIEVALPLEAINRESAREKSIRHGHPSTLHLWWARRPLAACRAVLFASIVDDPSSHPGEFPTEEDQERERQRLFRIIQELVKWENSNNEAVLDQARAEILKATDGNPPPVLDPFCGGGSIPLEAQRLGLEAYASDLNPVAVLITKALIEIPSEFTGKPPVNAEAPERLAHGATWTGAQGLAEDVRHYGEWMRDEAFKRIGHLYPKAKLPDGGQATVIAWLWARTVTCPNPACGAKMPLVRSFTLSAKKGKEWHGEPIVEGKSVRFDVRSGPAKRSGTKQRGSAECLVCGVTFDDATLRRQAKEFGIGEELMATAVEGDRQRIYLSPSNGFASAEAPETAWLEQPLPDNARWFSPPGYGLVTYRDLFTSRQLVALTTFSDLVEEARKRIVDDGGDDAYAEGVATYLGFVVNKLADMANSLCAWEPIAECPRHLFSRQAIPMVWDFAEGNPLSDSSGSWSVLLTNLMRSFSSPLMDFSRSRNGNSGQLDAAAAVSAAHGALICTDPPYYDNIGYADLSDFFYVWMRRSLGATYPDLFSTLLAPKAQELVATPYRFDGDRDRADEFFEAGLREVFSGMAVALTPDYPLTLFYAFKQAESLDGAVASTGWDTMLTGLLASGLSVTGTWPTRTEMGSRMVGQGTNALASSIVLVCRRQPTDAPVATRRELVNTLRGELPEALRTLQHGSIAPVDLAQAAIGPGMAIFSRFAKVLEADGSTMTVRTALGLINRALDEILAEQEGDFDHETRFAVTWFEQRGTAEGPYGEADVLARAKNTSVDGMVEAGVLFSRAGKVRLLAREEMPDDWDPVTDRRPTAWEAAQHLTRRLQTGGEAAAAELLRRLGSGYGEQARELAYRLYSICERKGRAQEALPYNALIVAWPEIARRVAGTPEAAAQQTLEV